jgi:undecaprenyl-diphosphatase
MPVVRGRSSGLNPSMARSHPWRALALAAASVAVGVLSSTAEGRRADEEAFRRINGNPSPERDAFFTGVTELGSIMASVGAAAVLAATGRRRTAVRALSAAGATWLAGQGLKKVFLRPRPYDAVGDTRLLIGKPNGTSWPSSHPAVLLTFVTVAGRDLGLGKPARMGLDMLASAVATSRSYVGVHFPSDTAGGLLLGRAIGLAWPADEDVAAETPAVEAPATEPLAVEG